MFSPSCPLRDTPCRPLQDLAVGHWPLCSSTAGWLWARVSPPLCLFLSLFLLKSAELWYAYTYAFTCACTNIFQHTDVYMHFFGHLLAFCAGVCKLILEFELIEQTECKTAISLKKEVESGLEMRVQGVKGVPDLQFKMYWLSIFYPRNCLQKLCKFN